jgi:hypothetical protein
MKPGRRLAAHISHTGASRRRRARSSAGSTRTAEPEQGEQPLSPCLLRPHLGRPSLRKHRAPAPPLGQSLGPIPDDRRVPAKHGRVPPSAGQGRKATGASPVAARRPAEVLPGSALDDAIQAAQVAQDEHPRASGSVACPPPPSRRPAPPQGRQAPPPARRPPGPHGRAAGVRASTRTLKSSQNGARRGL